MGTADAQRYPVLIQEYRVGHLILTPTSEWEAALWLVIEEPHRRQHHALNALRGALPGLLDSWHRLTVAIPDGNLPATGLAAAAGFTHEGTARAARWVDGRWRDVAHWAILPGEA